MQKHSASRRLPFANLSADPAQEYLADVITNDLTIALSRLRGAMIIAAGSAFTLKGKQVDPRQRATQLGVRYALQGTMLRSEDRIRISARLIDTQNSATLWSDQFDAHEVCS
jgi:adenylate cyclase